LSTRADPSAVLRRLRENGPAVLVPLAWGFVAAAHGELVAERAVLAAHVVMCTVIAGFTALSWADMADGVLLAWRRVLVVGFVVTLAGAVGLTLPGGNAALLGVALYGWMLLPAAGLAYTGRGVDRWPRAYDAGAALSLLGAATYAAAPALPPGGTIGGIVLVGVGQTVGILAAVLAY